MANSCVTHTKAYDHTIQNDNATKKTLTNANNRYYDYILEWSNQVLRFLVEHEEVLKV